MNNEPFAKYIAAIYRQQQILINHYLKPYGIGSGQYIFLMYISKTEGISQKELSTLMMIDKTTTTKAIKKLEDIGYIYRIKDLEDKRYFKLYITEKGKTFMPVLRDILNHVTNMVGESMHDDEYEEAIKALKLILNNVKSAVDSLKYEE